MRKSLISVLLSVVMLSAWEARAQSASADVPPGEVLRIVAEHYPPYEYMKDGVVTGINVEVTARIMDRLGVKHAFDAGYPFSRAWALIRSGNAEAVPSVSCQPDREPYIYCTPEQRAFAETGVYPRDYLWIGRYVFFADRRYASALKFESYDQLRAERIRVGICKDYSYDGKLLQAGLNTTTFVAATDAFRALANGEIELLPMDETIGHWMVAEMGLPDEITHLPNVIFEKPYQMMFAKKSSYPGLETIWTRFYAELRRMRDSGEMADIVNRYITPSYPYPLPRPLLFVAEEWAPYEYIENDSVVGIDVDMLKVVMRRLNLPYEIQLYPWSRAWMLAERGKADAVLSISYKSSREHLLYYTPEQAAFETTGKMPPDYLFISEYVFFVKRNRLNEVVFESYAQIKEAGYRVGTNKDYTYCPEFMAYNLGTREYPDTRSGLRALVNDEIDLYPMDRTVGLSELQNMGLSEVVTFIPRTLFSKPYLAPFVKGSDLPGLEGVMHAFYDQLRLLRATGEYDEIAKGFRQASQNGE